MIFSFILVFAGVTFQILAAMFSLLNFALPYNVVLAVQYFVSGFASIGYIFPIATLFQAVGVFISFVSAWYLLKLGLWAFSLIPFVNGVLHPPRFHSKISSTKKN